MAIAYSHSKQSHQGGATMTSNVESIPISSESQMNVAWVLSGDRNKASSRLQGYLIHEQLLCMGVKSSLIAINFSYCQSSISSQFLATAIKIFNGQFIHVIFEGPEWISTQLTILVRVKGLISICVRCDRYPFDYDRYFDLTILPTETLRDELSIQRARVIRDMVEVPVEKYKITYSQVEEDYIKVGWVGHESYGPFIFDFIERLKLNATIESKFLFETISTGPNFTHQWSEETIVDDILACDLAIIPIPEGDWFKTKSANRLTMMFSLGMPCVATLMPSYRLIGNNGKNVLFATTLDEFTESLLKLIDPYVRKSLGTNGRQTLAGDFTPVEVTKVWINAIQNSVRSNTKKFGLKARCLVLILSIGSKLNRSR